MPEAVFTIDGILWPAPALLRALTARNVRTFASSPAFELVLCLEGKPVARVSNDGRGGPHLWTPPAGSDDYRKARDLGETIGRATAACFPSIRYEAEDAAVCGLADGLPNGYESARVFVECVAADRARDAVQP